MDTLDPAFWAAAIGAAMLVGMAKGGLPMVGMLSVPVLALVMHPVAATALLAPLYVVTDMFGLHAYRRAFNRRVLLIMAPGATLGVVIGWQTAAIMPAQLVTGMIGLVGLVFSLSLLLKRGAATGARPARVRPGLFWATISGFTSFVSHAGGPPYQVYVLPLGLSKIEFAGTTTVLFAYVNLIKLLFYWELGQVSFGSLKIAAFLFVPGVLAVFAGVWLVRVISQALFFQLVNWALLLVSIKLLWDAVAG